MPRNFARFSRDSPQTLAFCSAGVCMGGGDVAAQMGIEGRSWEALDLQRLGAVTTFASLYLGLVQYRIYLLFDRVITPARFGKASSVVSLDRYSKTSSRVLKSQIKNLFLFQKNQF